MPCLHGDTYEQVPGRHPGTRKAGARTAATASGGACGGTEPSAPWNGLVRLDFAGLESLGSGACRRRSVTRWRRSGARTRSSGRSSRPAVGPEPALRSLAGDRRRRGHDASPVAQRSERRAVLGRARDPRCDHFHGTLGRGGLQASRDVGARPWRRGSTVQGSMEQRWPGRSRGCWSSRRLSSSSASPGAA